MKRFLWFTLFGVALFVPKNVYAVTLSLDSFPQTITSSEFEIRFSVSGAKAATNYFRVILAKENSTHSFTRTWNGTTWYDGSDGLQYFPLTVTSQTSGTLKAQIVPEIENGEYQLSIRRYTQSGSSASDTQTPSVVAVNIPHATLPPSPTPSPSRMPLPEVTHTSQPTHTKTVMPTATTTQSPIVTSTPELKQPVSETILPAVLSLESESPSPSPSPEIIETIRPHVSEEIIPEPNSLLLTVGIALTSLGLVSISAGGFTFWREHKSWYT